MVSSSSRLFPRLSVGIWHLPAAHFWEFLSPNRSLGPSPALAPRGCAPRPARLTTPGGGAGAAGADFDEGRDGGGGGGGGTGGEAGPRGGAVAWSWGVGDWDF